MRFAGLLACFVGVSIFACTSNDGRARVTDAGFVFDGSIDAAACTGPMPEGATCVKNEGAPGCVDLACIDGDWSCPDGTTGVALEPGVCGGATDSGVSDAQTGVSDSGLKSDACTGDASDAGCR